MLYRPEAPGDWGQMLVSDTIKTATDMLKTSDMKHYAKIHK